MKALCYQCGPKGGKPKTPRDVKQVTLHVEVVNGEQIITYLCGPCRRELGV